MDCGLRERIGLLSYPRAPNEGCVGQDGEESTNLLCDWEMVRNTKRAEKRVHSKKRVNNGP